MLNAEKALGRGRQVAEKMADAWKSDEWSNIFGISDEKDGEINFSALHGLKGIDFLPQGVSNRK